MYAIKKAENCYSFQPSAFLIESKEILVKMKGKSPFSFIVNLRNRSALAVNC